MWLNGLKNGFTFLCTLSLSNFFSLSLSVFFYSCLPRFDLTVRLKSHMVVCAGTAPWLCTSFLWASLLCPVRAGILQFVFSWWNTAAGFGAWSSPLAFITSCHCSFKVDYWRKVIQSSRFTKSCITAQCFYGKPFYRPSCGDRGTQCTQKVCQLHNPAPHRWSSSAQQTIKHWGGSVIHHEKQNFSSLQLHFMLGEEKSFLIKPWAT